MRSDGQPARGPSGQECRPHDRRRENLHNGGTKGGVLPRDVPKERADA